MTRRLYLHNPTILVSGQVNDSFSNIYPLADIPVKSVVGDLDDATHAGRTVIFGSAPGLDDLGRSYVRKVFGTGDLFIGYSSQGTHDGEINIAVDSYWAILDLRQPWSRIQRTVTLGSVPFVLQMKDYDQLFESNGAGVEFYPKANAGPTRAGVVDAITELLTVEFDAVNSYSMPFGLGLTDYLWNVGSGTITVGTSASAAITATFPVGVHEVSLTVTDTNNYEHTMYVMVVADDADGSLTIPKWFVESWEATQRGQAVSVRALSNIPRSTYPDGTVALIFDDDNGPDHYCQFVGWHHTDTAALEFVKTGFLRDTTLNLLDLAGKLDTLPGQAQALAHHDDVYTITVAADAALGAVLVVCDPLPAALEIGFVLLDPSLNEIVVQSNVAVGATAFGTDPLPAALTTSDLLTYNEGPRNWQEMYRPNLYMLLDYLARRHSFALELADWLWPTLDFALDFNTRSASAVTLYQQLAEQARIIQIDHNVSCNAQGQLQLRIDPMLQAAISRTSTVQATLAGHIRSVRLLHQRPPRYQWIRGGGAIEGWTYTATTVQVDYAIRATAFHSPGATTLNVQALPVAIPDDAVIDLIGLGGIRLPWVTVAANAAVNDTTVTVEPLADTVDVYDALVYTATEAGPDKVLTAFCIAPGKVYGQGGQTLTVSNKLVQNDGGLANMIGHLYERLNSEWGLLEFDLVGVKSLPPIDPSAMEWVTVGPLQTDHIPQRLLSLLVNGARLLPLSLTRRISARAEGESESWTLTAEVETVGHNAVIIEGSE